VAATSAAPQAPQSPDPPPADDEFRKELRARAEASRDSYYDVLGVPRDAPESAIAGAYFQLAKRWHPDRLGPAYSDVREVATKVFARMSEAHQVLSDPARRKEYDELEKAGQGAAEDQEQVQKIVRAAMNFQKAQVLLKRNNLPAAEEAARAALADAPDQADHLALVAWLEATKPNADLEARLRELDKAVSMEPANTRVRWFRGQILKRLGKERKALEDFRLIVEQDPRHVDAQREIRLHDMKRPGARTSHPPSDRGGEAGRASVPPGERGGIFGRLFKR
jgi:curved DNA-binding protein CbpA